MALAGLLAAQKATGKPLAEQKVLFLGAGEVSPLKGSRGARDLTVFSGSEIHILYIPLPS